MISHSVLNQQICLVNYSFQSLCNLGNKQVLLLHKTNKSSRASHTPTNLGKIIQVHYRLFRTPQSETTKTRERVQISKFSKFPDFILSIKSRSYLFLVEPSNFLMTSYAFHAMACHTEDCFLTPPRFRNATADAVSREARTASPGS